MKKEGVIAIFIGLAIGLIIAYGIYTANEATSKLKSTQNKQLTASSLPSNLPISLTLEVTAPENNIVTSVDEATVSGRTDPQATIAILAEDDEHIITADNQGVFSSTVNLIPGLNEIRIIAVGKTGGQKEKVLNVIQSKQSI